MIHDDIPLTSSSGSGRCVRLQTRCRKKEKLASARNAGTKLLKIFPVEAGHIDQSAAAIMISAFFARPAPVLLVDVCDDWAETADCLGVPVVDPDMKNLASVILLPIAMNRRNALKC